MSSGLEAACSSNATVITYMVTQPRTSQSKHTHTHTHTHACAHVHACEQHKKLLNMNGCYLHTLSTSKGIFYYINYAY